ncbi:hypothetical protein L7F22_040807, partial [Adiantum nelumboides]|nr:hypothetical protein [Adiantum nelumboides]
MATWASSRSKLNFAGVVATPPKPDNTARLQHEVERLRKENEELKQRLVSIEARLIKVEQCKSEEQTQLEAMFAKAKVEVETTLTKEVKAHVQEVVAHKVEDRVAFTLRERQRQEDTSLNVRIGGLLSDWKGEGDLKFHEAFSQIRATIPM